MYIQKILPHPLRLLIPVLLAATALFFLFATLDSASGSTEFEVTPGAPEPPPKLRIDDISWDGEQFVLDYSALFGMATGGQASDFVITTTLTVEKDEEFFKVPTEIITITIKSGAVMEADNTIQLEPNLVRWDRADGSVSGDVQILATSGLLNPASKLIDFSTTFFVKTVVITPTTEID